jgi:hypothetical protein
MRIERVVEIEYPGLDMIESALLRLWESRHSNNLLACVMPALVAGIHDLRPLSK